MTDPRPNREGVSPAARRRPPWLITRDFDAVAAHLDPWILAAEPHHDTTTSRLPLLGTPDWVTVDPTVRDASVAIYVLACLAEREEVVIAARLAAEIAAGREAYLVALRQASPDVSAAYNQHIVRRRAWGGPR